METTVDAPVRFTAAAAALLKNMMQAPDFNTSQLLRIGVKNSGCSGMGFVLGFDEQQKDDVTFAYDGIRCVMNAGHQLYLYGMEIGWQENEESRGFTFTKS